MLHDLTVVIHSVEHFAVGPKDKVRLQWGYLHEQGSTEVTRVSLHGIAVFDCRIRIWHIRKDDAFPDPVALHVCLQHIPYESRLPRPLEKLALHLSLVHPITGRMGIASAKGLLFNLELLAPRRTSPPTSVIVESKAERRSAIVEAINTSETLSGHLLDRRMHCDSVECGDMGKLLLQEDLILGDSAPDVIITLPEVGSGRKKRGVSSPSVSAQDNGEVAPPHKRGSTTLPLLTLPSSDSRELAPFSKRGSVCPPDSSRSMYCISTEGCSVDSSPLRSRMTSRQFEDLENAPSRSSQHRRECYCTVQ